MMKMSRIIFTFANPVMSYQTGFVVTDLAAREMMILGGAEDERISVELFIYLFLASAFLFLPHAIFHHRFVLVRLYPPRKWCRV